MTRALLVATLAATALTCPAAHGQSEGPALFVLNNVSDTVASFTVERDGTPTFVTTTFSSDGPQAAALSPDGRFLAVAHGTIDPDFEVFNVFRVEPDATLEIVTTIMTFSSALGISWASDTIVVVTRASPGLVQTYELDPDAETLLLVDSVPTGGFLTAVPRHPSLPIIYPNDSSGDFVHAYEVDPAGMLTLLDTANTSPVFPLDPAVTRDGTALYGAGGISNGSHSITGLSIGPGGDLTLMEDAPFTSAGNSPAHIAIAEDDAIVFAGHGSDATVRSFLVGAGGVLSETGFVFDVGLQGSIGDLAVLGDVLYVTDETTATDGITGLYAFAIQPDGTLIRIGDIVSTAGTRPEMIITWTPPAPAGDIDGDGDVDAADLALLLGRWGPCVKGEACPADLNGDGAVNAADLAVLLGAWG